MMGTMIHSRGANIVRHFSYTSVTWQQKSNADTRLKGYLMKSYLRYMNYYEQMLEKRFPAAMKVYKVFKYGIHDFYMDLKSFVKVRLTVLSLPKEEAFRTLTRRQIELYDQMPKDMLKIAPVLLFSALPFANYVVFPLAYMYPRTLLTAHFWTDQQKEEFNASFLSERLKSADPLLKCLHSHAKAIPDQDLRLKWADVLQILQDGSHPTVQQIIACKPLFVAGPYSISNLHFGHRNSLIRLHGLSLGFHPTSKLCRRAFILKEMDKAIVREGGVKKMKDEELKVACLVRGFHTTQLSHEDAINLLNNWIMLSDAVQKESYSILLHSPVLLGYNIRGPVTKLGGLLGK